MKGAKGFTLVETLISLAISGIIFTVIGGVIHQISTSGEYGNNLLTANHQLQKVSYWFSQDTQSASSAKGGETLVLNMTDGRTIKYYLEETALLREENKSSVTLAQDVEDIEFVVDNKLVSMDITVTVPGREEVTETGLYEVCLRAEN